MFLESVGGGADLAAYRAADGLQVVALYVSLDVRAVAAGVLTHGAPPAPAREAAQQRLSPGRPLYAQHSTGTVQRPYPVSRTQKYALQLHLILFAKLNIKIFLDKMSFLVTFEGIRHREEFATDRTTLQLSQVLRL